MHYRSWLLVPGDSEKALHEAVSAAADVIVVDLEGAVAAESRSLARRLATEWLSLHRKQITGVRLGRWVRINPLESHDWRDDLIAVMQAAPDGIVLPKAAGPEAVQQLAAELYELEQANQIPSGSTRIIPLAGQTPHAAMTIVSYIGASLPRLAGLGWDEEPLSAALGATRKRGRTGAWTDTFRFVRAQVLLTAHARGIMAVDTLHPESPVKSALKSAADARADGFTGMLASVPAQVAPVNEAFSPGAAELGEAHAIVNAFEASHGAGPLQVGQRMVGQQDLELAKRMLGREPAAGQLHRPILRSA